MTNLRNKSFMEMAKENFVIRMKELLKDEEDFNNYAQIATIHPPNYIRCNTIKISSQELFNRLSKKWDIIQPFIDYPEIILIKNQLNPGELGRSIEHSLGYFYVQELSSMLPLLVLKPNKNDIFLDLCASPGSKTTQAAAMMENKGILIANDQNVGRIMILSANTQRCSVTNAIITMHDGVALCKRLAKTNFKFDKILLDAPCSCEGTTRSSPKTLGMHSENLIKHLCSSQKKLFQAALSVLKDNGEIVYSTCTYAPEENEEVINFALENFPLKLQEINLPIKTRKGLLGWKEKKYCKEMEKCVRVYPQDNDTEGFFIAKLKKIPKNS